jgi:hypothetical protein
MIDILDDGLIGMLGGLFECVPSIGWALFMRLD